MFNFEHLDILCASIRHPSKTLYPFEFSLSFHVKFRASRNILGLSRTFDWIVMASWISRELPLFNFKRFDILLSGIGHLNQKSCPFQFSLRFHVEFRASPYIMLLIRTSEWKVMTIWISQELPIFIFKRRKILFVWIGHPTPKLWAFEFALCFHV